MRGRLCLAASCAALIALSGCARDRDEANENHESMFMPQDEAEVKAINDSAMTLLAAGNTKAWAGLFAEDAIVQPAHAKEVRGRAAIESWAAQLPPIQEIRFTDGHYAGSGDLAYYTSALFFTPKGIPTDTGKQLVVYRKNNGRWRAQALIFNSDAPLPMPPAASKRK